MRDLIAENKVRGFYEGDGWNLDQEGDTLDARLWEDLRPCAADYVASCRRKLLNYLPTKGDFLLDAASGPVQYPEYLEYSAGFRKRICVDISQKALDRAKTKLGDRAEIICSSILSLPLPDNHVDATISLHTIYHIDKDEQEAAVRQLLRVTKPKAPVLVIYSNPNRLLARIRRIFSRPKPPSTEDHLYFFAHPLGWWKRFENESSVEIVGWRSLTAEDAKRLIPGNILGKWLLAAILFLENSFPGTAARLGAYPLIILRKKAPPQG